jgi:hypothetical protein
MFLSDGLGYLAVMGVLLGKTFGASDEPVTSSAMDDDLIVPADTKDGLMESSNNGIDVLFVKLTYGVALISIGLLVPTAGWLARRLPTMQLVSGSGSNTSSISRRVEALELENHNHET